MLEIMETTKEGAIAIVLVIKALKNLFIFILTNPFITYYPAIL